jgi:hypothetical protein
MPMPDGKPAALAATGTLNHNPEAVVDPPFRGGGFFDPRDLLQLRYEMVRRHRVDAVPVAVTARLFGVSLPTAYQAHAAFEAAGLGGLLPKRRGPKHGHKLTPEDPGIHRAASTRTTRLADGRSADRAAERLWPDDPPTQP